MERSREYLIDAINRRDPDILRDIVDTLDARLSLPVSKKGPSEVIKTIQEKIQSFPITWATLTGKPTTFPPDPHTHSQYLTEEVDPTVPDHVKEITAEEAALLTEEIARRGAWGGRWGYRWH